MTGTQQPGQSYDLDRVVFLKCTTSAHGSNTSGSPGVAPS